MKVGIILVYSIYNKVSVTNIPFNDYWRCVKNSSVSATCKIKM